MIVCLKRRRRPAASDGLHQASADNEGEGAPEEAQDNDLQMEPGCLLHIENLKEGTLREDIKVREFVFSELFDVWTRKGKVKPG